MPVPYAKRKDYFKKYRKRKLEEKRLSQRTWYQENRNKVVEKQAKANAERGHAPRKTIKNPSVRIIVPKTRRYVIIAGKVYFNSQLGFDPSELRRIIADIRTMAAA